MANTKKLIQAAAGAGGGAGLNVEDVFSTYLYEGTGSNITVTHNIDLSTEGGLVWVRPRITSDHWLWDSARGTQYSLATNNTAAQTDMSTNGTVFNTDGFTDRMQWGSGTDVASWTFRKAPKFFDVVTYTGDGTGTRQLSHNLDSTIGTIIVKRTDGTGDWWVYHRSARSTNTDGYLRLNLTNAEAGSNQIFPASTYNSTQFTVGNSINVSSETYVAYLFAHNDGDGEFGPDGDADIIKCGSYTGNNSTDGPEIDLGFEPQWLMIKKTNAADYWVMVDNMRGVTTGGNDNVLKANASDAELTTLEWLNFTPTGFKLTNNLGQVNDNGNFIYIAIRRGPMAVPESATDVFAMDFRFSSEAQALNPEHQYYSGFPVDMHLNLRRSGGGVYAYSRLQGGSNFLRTSTTDAEVSSTTNQFGSNEGLYPLGSTNTEDTTTLGHMFRRAPNYFDVVAYTGNSTAGRTVSHNLGVAPEMMWIKARNDAAASWAVYAAPLGNTKYLRLNSANAAGTANSFWNSTTPTDTVFTLGSDGDVNFSSSNYIAYLFASLDGVSKVGSYTGTGSGGHQIDCGFSSGARFVLIKRSSGSQNWYVFDTERGIVAGNDPSLNLNDTSAEYSGFDYIDPYSSGFELASGNISTNASGETYIFYAIA